MVLLFVAAFGIKNLESFMVKWLLKKKNKPKCSKSDFYSGILILLLKRWHVGQFRMAVGFSWAANQM